MICTMIIPLPVSAAKGEQSDPDQVVKVGIFSLGNFMGWDENGDACGYNVDYLNRIAQVTHWK